MHKHVIKPTYRLGKKSVLNWLIALLALILIVGCSPTGTQASNPPEQTSNTSKQTDSVSETNSPSQTPQALLSNMMQLAQQGKIINSSFVAKATVFDDVKKSWGEPDKMDWVPAAKGNYATYSNHAIVFGINKGSQIFEIRSYDKQLKNISLAKSKEVYGTPAYDVQVNGEKIIGYTAGKEYKIELVFPQPSSSQPDPVLDHYLVLYPRGTANSMASDPGRQW